MRSTTGFASLRSDGSGRIPPNYATAMTPKQMAGLTEIRKMVNHLGYAQKTHSLESELSKYRRPQVLIIDELGYVSLDTQASNLFCQVISSTTL